MTTTLNFVTAPGHQVLAAAEKKLKVVLGFANQVAMLLERRESIGA